MLIVDTHAHLFSPDEYRYPPRPNPSRPPEGTGTLDHLHREMNKAGVRAACAIQVSGFYGFDNRWILAVSKLHPGWLAGVVTLNPDEADSPAKLAEMQRDAGIRAVRSVKGSGRRFDTDGVRAIWRAAGDLGLTVNVIGNADDADDLARMLGDFPSQTVALDHSLNLQADGPVEETLAALRKLAVFPNANVKLSNIANGPQGCADGYPCRSFHGEIKQVIDLFGPDRCAWGAHFPLERYSPSLTYSEAVAIYRDELGLSDSDKAAVLGQTANRLWFNGELRS